MSATISSSGPATAGGAAVSVSGLVKSYGSVQALAGVDLEVAPGTVLGLLGPNGAGKTTIIRILTTLLKPDAGSARVAGLDVVSRRGAAARADRARRAVRGGRREPDRPREPDDGRAPVRRVARAAKRARPGAARALRTARRRQPARRRPTPAACAAGSTWRPRSWPSHRCCSSTSRRPASTRAAGCSCGRRSRGWSPRARPCC